MAKRKTRCLTWGETKRWCERSAPPNSVIITYESYVTLCGKEGEADAPAFNGAGARPQGVCPGCWARYKKAWAGAQAFWATGVDDVD